MTDPLMTPAWAAFVRFAYDHRGAREAFALDTGRALPAPKSPLDAMIDNATGATAAAAEEFLLWVTETSWGVDGVPDEVLAKIEARRKTRAVSK